MHEHIEKSYDFLYFNRPYEAQLGFSFEALNLSSLLKATGGVVLC